MWESADSGSASKSFNAARDLQGALNDTLLPANALNGLEPLALGIGIEQGPVLVGSIGPAHRRSHTLLGDTVGGLFASRNDRRISAADSNRQVRGQLVDQEARVTELST